MILNKTNNKKYVGQTVRLLEKRIYEYKSWYNNGHIWEHNFWKDYKKNGVRVLPVETFCKELKLP